MPPTPKAHTANIAWPKKHRLGVIAALLFVSLFSYALFVQHENDAVKLYLGWLVFAFFSALSVSIALYWFTDGVAALDGKVGNIKFRFAGASAIFFSSFGLMWYFQPQPTTQTLSFVLQLENPDDAQFLENTELILKTTPNPLSEKINKGQVNFLVPAANLGQAVAVTLNHPQFQAPAIWQLQASNAGQTIIIKRKVFTMPLLLRMDGKPLVGAQVQGQASGGNEAERSDAQGRASVQLQAIPFASAGTGAGVSSPPHATIHISVQRGNGKFCTIKDSLIPAARNVQEPIQLDYRGQDCVG